jgi:hypothetical protein
VVRGADVIVSLEWVDLHSLLLQVNRDTSSAPAKVAHVSMDAVLHRGWSMDYLGLPPVDVPVMAGANAVVAQLIPVLQKKLNGKTRWNGESRKAVAADNYSEKSATEIAPRDVEVALARVPGTEKFCLAHVTIAGRVTRIISPIHWTSSVTTGVPVSKRDRELRSAPHSHSREGTGQSCRSLATATSCKGLLRSGQRPITSCRLSSLFRTTVRTQRRAAPGIRGQGAPAAGREPLDL